MRSPVAHKPSFCLRVGVGEADERGWRLPRPTPFRKVAFGLEPPRVRIPVLSVLRSVADGRRAPLRSSTRSASCVGRSIRRHSDDAELDSEQTEPGGAHLSQGPAPWKKPSSDDDGERGGPQRFGSPPAGKRAGTCRPRSRIPGVRERRFRSAGTGRFGSTSTRRRPSKIGSSQRVCSARTGAGSISAFGADGSSVSVDVLSIVSTMGDSGRRG